MKRKVTVKKVKFPCECGRGYDTAKEFVEHYHKVHVDEWDGEVEEARTNDLLRAN